MEEKKITKEAAKVVLDTFDKTVEENFHTQVSQYEHSDLEISVRYVGEDGDAVHAKYWMIYLIEYVKFWMAEFAQQ